MPTSRFKQLLVYSIVGLVLLTIFGLLWAFVVNPGGATGLASGSMGWYLFSYAMGLTMIVLPCTLPLAFVIVPMVMKKGAGKGFGMAIAFGLGVAITLSLYGIIAALVGKVAIGSVAAPIEVVKNWIYFIAGIFAYLFALGEIGLIKVRMPSYTGAAPAFIQKQGDYLKALLLGLFLGNIGVGCPHPATPLILVEIASSQNVFYGWSLFLVHAIGRIIPLLLLALLAILGVNALNWLVSRKDKLEKATGWMMVFVAGFILILGLFTHDWWVASGQHTLFEAITQEHFFTGLVAEEIGTGAAHSHGLEDATGPGLFGLPVNWGNWALVFLWVVPLFWYHYRDKKMNQGNVPAWRMPFMIALTGLLAAVFIYILPSRFLAQAEAPHDHGEVEGMMEHHEEMMNHEEGAVSADHSGHGELHEASEVTSGLVVELLPPANVQAGQFAWLNFKALSRPSNTPVPASSLQINHEKLMHVIGVKSDLSEFFHIHPEPSVGAVGNFGVSQLFREAGTYKLWAEVTSGGATHTFGQTPIVVNGRNPGTPPSKEIDLSRNEIVGNYQVGLDLPAKVSAGRNIKFSFDLHTVLNEEVVLENYLGVPMHLAIISEDLKQFLHAHPASLAGDGHNHIHFLPGINRALAHGGVAEPGVTSNDQHGVPFEIEFPAPGRYKLFAQFRPAGTTLPPDQALKAEFWVEVGERRGFGDLLMSWWGKLLVSLVLIFGLSKLVKKFLIHE